VKFDANIFIGDRYIAILRLRRFGCEMPIPANFGEAFGGLIPNVLGYCRDPQKAHLGRAHAFWHIDRPDW